MSLRFIPIPRSTPATPGTTLFLELPVVENVERPVYFGKKKCCGKFRKKGKKMCKKCPGRN